MFRSTAWVCIQTPPQRISGASGSPGVASTIGAKRVNFVIQRRSIQSFSRRAARPFHVKGP